MFVLVVLPKETTYLGSWFVSVQPCTFDVMGQVSGDDPTEYHPGSLARSPEAYKEASIR